MAEARSFLPYWLWPGDSRPPQEIDDEIAEELRLHLDLLAEEYEQRGMTPEDAKWEAEQRFGDLESLTRRCRDIKRGDVPMLNRIQVALTCLLLLGVVFLGIRDWNLGVSTVQYMNQTTSALKAIKSDVENLRGELLPQEPDPAANAATAAEFGEVTGVVVSNEGSKPIEGARVLAVFKTWLDGRYAQVGRSTLTDSEGRFRFDKAVPLDQRHGVQLAVFADGYAFRSRYQYNERPSGHSLDPYDFWLVPSQPVRVRITTGASGNGSAAPCVFLPVEQQVDAYFKQTQIVYREGIELVQAVSDEEGWVTLPWFAGGSKATFVIDGPAGEDKCVIYISGDGKVTPWLQPWQKQIYSLAWEGE